MNFASQWFLTFLINSLWQVVAIGVLALLCDRLLRRSPARHRHGLWVGAFVLSLLVPVATSIGLVLSGVQSLPTTGLAPAAIDLTPITAAAAVSGSTGSPSLTVSAISALIIAGVYLAFVLYRAVRLTIAWRRTRQMFESSESNDPSPALAVIVERCSQQFKAARVPVLFSELVSSPVTIGTRKPVIILPAAMRDETDEDLLLSAIGHELVHVKRRDYPLNLLYELILIPLSFHPAMTYVKRRIDHTRELCCDELVTRQLIKAEDYARSLLRLASSAAVMPEPAMTTVGMGNADDLEVRIMSLLKGSVARPNDRKYLLLGGAIAMIALGVAIGGFGFKIGVTEVSAQKTKKQEPCTEVGPNCPRVTVTTDDNEGFIREIRANLAAEHPEFTPDQVKERIELALKARTEQLVSFKVRDDGVDQAKLAKEAQVSMEQAIQTATAAHPGIVIESALVRERGLPMYRIVVLDKDSADGAVTMMLVNGQDGQIVTNENGKLRVRSPQ